MGGRTSKCHSRGFGDTTKDFPGFALPLLSHTEWGILKNSAIEEVPHL